MVQRRLIPKLSVCWIILCLLPGSCQRQPPSSVSQQIAKMSEAEAKTKIEQYWQHAKEEVYKSVPVLLAQHETELSRGLKYRVIIRGDRARKWIALTFHHVNLTRIPPMDVAAEIKACGEVIQSITGKAPHLFRPPGGDYDRNVAEVAESLGYSMVLWTDDPGDYANPPAHLLENRLFSRLENGGIILLHDGIAETIDLLPRLIEYLQAKGYRLVTVDEMIRAQSR